jgi:hypothetical protein
MRTKKITSAYPWLFGVLVILHSLISFSDTVYAWSDDPTVNTPICMASYKQSSPAITSDGAGGAIITWQDYRGGN